MTDEAVLQRLRELGESEYRELLEVFCGLAALKSSIKEMHDGYLADGAPPEFDRVEAIHILVDQLYASLERFIRPECDPDSAYEPIRLEK